MSVLFSKLVFNNKNALDVTVTISSPPGHQVNTTRVPADKSATIILAVPDATSVEFSIESDHPGPDKATINVNQLPLVLQTLEVDYSIGSVTAKAATATIDSSSPTPHVVGKKTC
jgi:hypothetical protein